MECEPAGLVCDGSVGGTAASGDGDIDEELDQLLDGMQLTLTSVSCGCGSTSGVTVIVVFSPSLACVSDDGLS